MSLYRHGNTIYRVLNDIEDSTDTNYTKTPTDLQQYKAKELRAHYYGSDDDGESKDLRKNIASSFKKFQQSRMSSLT